MASHPERLQYIYFNTVLLLRAASRLAPYLSAYDYCTSTSITPHHHSDQIDLVQEVRTLVGLQNVLDIAKYVGKFDERVLFRGENANVLSCNYHSCDLLIGGGIDSEARVQGAFSERFAHHGLYRV